MGVDLHRIGTGISSGTSRTGFGTIVSFRSAPSFPAYGTFNSWSYDVTYPIANGGASVTPSSTAYPSQFCDVQVKNDGAGGTYTDWSTATDIQYFAASTQFESTTGNAYISISTSCNGSQSVVAGSSTTAYYHDGSGGYTTAGGYSWSSYGTSLFSETCTFDDGNGGTYDVSYGYYSDSYGGYYTV